MAELTPVAILFSVILLLPRSAAISSLGVRNTTNYEPSSTNQRSFFILVFWSKIICSNSFDWLMWLQKLQKKLKVKNLCEIVEICSENIMEKWAYVSKLHMQLHSDINANHKKFGWLFVCNTPSVFNSWSAKLLINVACKNIEHAHKLQIRVRFIIEVRIATGVIFDSDPNLCILLAWSYPSYSWLLVRVCQWLWQGELTSMSRVRNLGPTCVQSRQTYHQTRTSCSNLKVMISNF